MRKKVTIVGAGATGGSMVEILQAKGYADIVVVDIIEGLPQGKALDQAHAGPLVGSDARIIGTNDWKDTAGSDVVVITSGSPRKPGMSREDLVNINANIVRDVAAKAVKHSPDTIIVEFANPMDAMCHVAKDASKLPRNRIIGQGGMLDSTRFRTFLGWEVGASVKDVDAYVLGGHTDATMVPIVSHAFIGGIPLRQLLPKDRIDAIVERTRKAGTEIVGLLGTSAWYSPAWGTIEMVESILLDRKRILPCSIFLEGEYGIKGSFVGVLAQLGAGGLEKVIEVELEPDEVAGLKKAADAVLELVGLIKK
ncbi:MAG: malate dehydrogenase [Dehalococcoidia bacterium]|nr:MAG: malate dehydrogenase [Dehalococcoidia bacterium]